MQFKLLKQRHRKDRDTYHPTLTLRVHRALSWLDKAEQCGKDIDARFIFLWIAFNAAYASRLSAEGSATENRVFKDFLATLLALDTGKQIEGMLWQRYHGPIRLLLENPYVFPPFWQSQNGTIPKDAWQAQFKKAKVQALRALSKQNTLTLLSFLLPRIYMLRNQLVHGGATWQSKVNRDQVRDCTAFMADFVPLVISIMMDNPTKAWSSPVYPVVELES